MPATQDRLAFRVAPGPDPHRSRTKRILDRHPEVRTLIGNNPWTFLWIVGLSVLQLVIASLLVDQPVWVGVALGCLVGAAPALGLYFLMHECSHQLVFRSRRC